MACYSGVEKYAFVSYSHKNSATVVEAINRLSTFGARIWYDEGLAPSDEYIEVIAEKIDKSSFFIVFMSRDSLASRYCRDEIRFAYESGKRIMTIYLEDVELSAGYKMMLNGGQSCQLREMKNEVIEAIARKLPSEVVNDGGRLLHTTDRYSFLFKPRASGCGYTIERVDRETGVCETLVSEGFPHCSEYVIDNVSRKRHYGENFALTVTVTWDFTYTRSGHDDDYYEETYEYVFFNLSGKICSYVKNTLERHDLNTGETIRYDYVKGIDTHTDRDGSVSSILGLDCFGNYWHVTGKKVDSGE